MKKAPFSAFLLAIAFAALTSGASAQQTTSPAVKAVDPLAWPPVTQQTRPWTRWWWMGSAVDKDDLTKELNRYREAGLGGVEITPIYGVKGREKEFIDYLSPQWMEMMQHSVTTAKGLDMGVDMANGTGWCFGGPNVSDADANASVVWRTFEVKPGEKLNEKFDKAATQALMAYPAGGKWKTEMTVISGNVAQDHSTEWIGPLEITDKIGTDGSVDWTAPDAVGAGGAWTVYAVSQKPSGVKVKRPAPGGAGPMLNLLYGSAMDRYLQRFTEAFNTAGKDAPKPAGMFHDSYEYKSDWSPDFFAQFEKRRGYKLQNELPALFGREDNDHVARVKCDYRETISDIQAEESIPAWTKWAHEHGFTTREQAHGSPGNWLDIYAAADIPETEMFYNDRDILVSKFASSAAHVTGKNLVGSESCTWAAEHFTETLADLKAVVDDLFLSGVNRVTFHGTAYSPDDAAWPGWCFYASTELNPRNALWHDLPALTAYITRVQSVLQAGKSDNNVLLYWPIYDTWHNSKGMVQQFTIHGRDWFRDRSVGTMAEQFQKRGVLFDYVSDNLLAKATSEREATAPSNETGYIDGVRLGGRFYTTLVVPKCEHMPVETMKKLLELAAGGATIIFEDQLPTDVPGLIHLEEGRAELKKLSIQISNGSYNEGGNNPFGKDSRRVSIGRGTVIVGPIAPIVSTLALMEWTIIDFQQDSFSRVKDRDLLMVRRDLNGEKFYFVVNHGKQRIDEDVQFIFRGEESPSMAQMDPMTGKVKLLQSNKDFRGNNRLNLRLQLEAGESVVFHTLSEKVANGTAANLLEKDGQPIELKGVWNVKFTQGGPTLPPPVQTEQLASWTKLGGEPAQAFAGTALYTLNFDAPTQAAAHYSLDLGSVCASARVKLNGKDLGTVFVKPFCVPVEGLKPQGNVLEVEVTGTSANRIRDLDVRKVPWKIFYDTNIVTVNYKPFDASGWPIADQGLLGPVTLQPEKEIAVAP